MKTKFDFTKPSTLVFTALLCTFLWGSAFPSIKIGYSLFHIESADTASQILFAGSRFFLAGILTVLLGSLIKKRFLKPNKDSIKNVFKLSLVQTLLQYLFFYIGLAHTSGVKASIINGTNVFIAILFSALIFKEKLTAKKIIGCVLGFLGIIIINLNGQGLSFSFSVLGEGAIFMSAIMYALSSCMIKGYTKTEDAFTLSGYQFFIGGFIMMIIGSSMGGKLSGFTPASTSLLVYMAMISAVSYSLWGVLLKYNPVSKVTIFGFSNPMFGVILSAILLNERNQAFTLRGLVSLVLVCLGIYIVNAPEKKKVNA